LIRHVFLLRLVQVVSVLIQFGNEWTNLAADLQYKEVIRQLRASLPQVNQK
jgi:hypothetical protein